MQATGLLSHMTETTFADMVDASPRKVREMLFSQLGIKAKKKTVGIRLNEKRSERTKKLYDRLVSTTDEKEKNLCGELVRNWLYTKRPMLKAALDYLGIPNDNGLVESETDFFAQLSVDKVKALIAHLCEQYPKEEVMIYLRFVQVPNLD